MSRDKRRRFRAESPGRFWDVLVVRPRFVLSALLVPLVIVVACVWIGAKGGWSLEGALKFAGFAIGVVGLLRVAYGLWRTRQLFTRSSVWTRLGGWAKDVVALAVQPEPEPLEAREVQINFNAGGALATGRRTQLPTIEERLAALETGAAEAEKSIKDVQAEARNRDEQTRVLLRAEGAQIQQQIFETQNQLMEFSVGGLDLEFMGLVWLIWGLAVATYYEEIATWPICRFFL